jgi:excisionase family DNA binding protein
MNKEMERNSRMKKDRTNNKFAYSVDDVSEQTSLSKAFLRNEIRAGNLKISRFGRRVLILHSDLQNYLNKKEST